MIVRKGMEMTGGRQEGRRFYIRYTGGLGDVLRQIYFRPKLYLSIGELKDNDRMLVDIFCHNIHSPELFEWHPNRDRLKINYRVGPFKKNLIRNITKNISIRHPPVQKQNRSRIEFHLSAKDQIVLKDLPSKYVCVCGGGSAAAKKVPRPLLNNVVNRLSDMGIKTVQIGKDYKRAHKLRVSEPRSKNASLNLINKLSVPGSLYVVKNSLGLVCGHSSMFIYARAIGRRHLILYPMSQRKIHRHLKPNAKNKNTVHCLFSEYDHSYLGDFLSI